MLNKEQIKGIFKVGFTLCAITAAAALVLAFVNSMTAPVIAKNTAEKQAISMQKVLPEAKEFSDENLINDNMDKMVTAVYEGKDESGNNCGYAVMVSPKGYGGDVSMAVGVDADLKVSGLDIVSQSETAGLGAKCVNEDFRNQFIGKSSGITVSKSGAKDNEIDAITSATITSKAVTLGVNTALEAVAQIEEDK
ncbi:MAG: RnfABCDGE type electron transport complex subunit G [Clostridia bacterium]|nr:RnfABCDGE type electron transport complex subunit G [Clostridia bacterium]